MFVRKIDINAQYFCGIKEIDIKDVIRSERDGQVRVNGIDPRHIEALKNSFREDGLPEDYLLVVERVGPLFRIVNGEHSYLTYEELMEEEPEKYPPEVKVAIVKFSSQMQREDFQLEMNKAPPALGNSVKDVARVINHKIEYNKSIGVIETEKETRKMINCLVDRFCSNMSNSSKNKVRTLVKINNLAINQKNKNYSNGEAKALIRKSNVIPWKGKEAGDISNNYAIILAPLGPSFRARIGDAIFKKMDNPDLKVALFVWKSDAVGENVYSGIDKHRLKILEEAKRINELKSFRLIDEVYFLGQMLESPCDEEENSFITVEEYLENLQVRLEKERELDV